MPGIVNPIQIKRQLKQIGKKCFTGNLMKIARCFKQTS